MQLFLSVALITVLRQLTKPLGVQPSILGVCPKRG